MPEFAASQHPDVLYVEDRSIHVLMMQALFERLPARLVVARDAAHAVQLARELHPRLLLLEPNLPDGRGPELLAQLRELGGCRGVPAVAVTTEACADFVGQGFAETWLKPLDPRRALARLRVLLDAGAGHAMACAAGA